MGYVKNTSYYTGEVYEFNLPTGWSCPFAKECLVKVDKNTGKFDIKADRYKCYAAYSERYPAVRKHRWNNLKSVFENKTIPELPVGAKSIRIHASGDFFNQEYFDLWLEFCNKHPEVEFWAFTKSVGYWVARIGEIPSNLVLTASYGGRQDALIYKHSLKHCIVVKTRREAKGLPIDTNDDYARLKDVNFALLDNQANNKTKTTID